MGVRIRIARSAAELDQVFRLRHAVLVDDEGVLDAQPSARILDRFDAFPTTVNLIASTGKGVVGAVRATTPTDAGSPCDGHPEFASALPADAVVADVDQCVLSTDARCNLRLGGAILGMAAYWALRRGATHLRGLARPDVEAPFLEHGWTRVAERACDAVSGLDVVPMVFDLRSRSDRFLALLERERIDDAFESFERQYNPAGESIVREGERGDEAFIIVSGAVDVLVGGGDADPIRVATLGPGDLFGELSLLSDEPRSATVDAHTDVVLMVLGRDAFERQLSESPKTAKRLIRLIGARMAGRATGSGARPVSGDVTGEITPPPL